MISQYQLSLYTFICACKAGASLLTYVHNRSFSSFIFLLLAYNDEFLIPLSSFEFVTVLNYTASQITNIWAAGVLSPCFCASRHGSFSSLEHFLLFGIDVLSLFCILAAPDLESDTFVRRTKAFSEVVWSWGHDLSVTYVHCYQRVSVP